MLDIGNFSAFDTDIKLPSRKAVSGRGRLVTKRKFECKLFQITPVGKYRPEEEEVVYIETVVEGERGCAYNDD